MPIQPTAVASAAEILSGVRDLAAGAGRRFDVPLLTAGLALHVLSDVVRNGGWYTVLRSASPAHSEIRVRDVQAAAFAGGGVNAVVPARAGDLVKVALLRRRAGDARLPTLMATFLPETFFEWVVGAVLLAWVLACGYLPVETIVGASGLAGGHTVRAAVLVAAVVAALVAGALLLRRAAHRLYLDLAAGLTILRRPRAFVAGVVSWQLAGRVIRLAAIACCLSACRLPGDVAAAAFVMAVEGGTRVGFAPATAALRVGLLAYGLPLAGGSAAGLGAVIAYLTVVRALHTALLLAIAAVVLVATLGGGSPRRALAAVRRVRAPVAEPLPAEAPAPVTAR